MRLLADCGLTVPSPNFHSSAMAKHHRRNAPIAPAYLRPACVSDVNPAAVRAGGTAAPAAAVACCSPLVPAVADTVDAASASSFQLLRWRRNSASQAAAITTMEVWPEMRKETDASAVLAALHHGHFGPLGLLMLQFETPPRQLKVQPHRNSSPQIGSCQTHAHRPLKGRMSKASSAGIASPGPAASASAAAPLLLLLLLLLLALTSSSTRWTQPPPPRQPQRVASAAHGGVGTAGVPPAGASALLPRLAVSTSSCCSNDSLARAESAILWVGVGWLPTSAGDEYSGS